jgi:hypothetical protein
MADFAEFFMGSDLNGDTIPDYGLCSLNGAAVAGPQALLMQIASSKLQYLGSDAWSCFESPGLLPATWSTECD